MTEPAIWQKKGCSRVVQLEVGKHVNVEEEQKTQTYVYNYCIYNSSE